ncbi:uncharacterized protein LOC141885776 [Acropora palmata]|uniref:uncharacterized protein LOC141885776 n=1 Tax=Acropora palmata TaxID=6131 RepID=UPI003DA05AD4
MDSPSRIKESRGKRPLHPLVTTTPERQGQNRDIPEKTSTETSTAPDQAVVAVNLGEQGPSSISEAVVHPDLTTKNQYIVGDVVSSDRENGSAFEEQRFWTPFSAATRGGRRDMSRNALNSKTI